MPKSLVIVESPTKVKTLKGFLGPDFTVMGSQGHVRDLPAKGINVDLKNNFEPTYELLPTRSRIIDDLRRAAAQADIVYLASDPDREGEAIAWHIREALHLKKVKRIEFNEITKTAVQKALDHAARHQHGSRQRAAGAAHFGSHHRLRTVAASGAQSRARKPAPDACNRSRCDWCASANAKFRRLKSKSIGA